MNKITIDEKACLKHKMTPTEVLFALAIRSSESPMGELLNMENREILVKDRDVYKITQHFSDVLDEILCDSQGTEKTDVELLALANKMRKCFPEGKMPGTPYYYRCNNGEVARKMKKFFLQYGNYPDEEIVNACKRFVASFQGNYHYLPLIKYFISKLKNEMDEEGNVHKVEHSPLADYLENKESEEGVVINDDSWLTTSRN